MCPSAYSTELQRGSCIPISKCSFNDILNITQHRNTGFFSGWRTRSQRFTFGPSVFIISTYVNFAKNPRALTTVAMERKSCGVFKDFTAVGNKTQPHRLLHISSVVASAPLLAVHRTEFKAWRLDVSCHNASWKSWLTSPLTALCRLYVVCMCASTRGDSCPS